MPTLIANSYRASLQKPLREGTLSLAVKAINMGVPYQKTMERAPYNMAIANAGLIFQLVRAEVKKVSEQHPSKTRGDILKWTSTRHLRPKRVLGQW
jgi:hypothetical protein